MVEKISTILKASPGHNDVLHGLSIHDLVAPCVSAHASEMNN